ncbi:efflux RND transporter permease subunit, partial [Salmonella enterica]|uniref:efflux RND transporter permease subunit n=1 Tax=Salmonella enterica TaxID=28901 RepID=UPI0020C5A617
YFAHPSPNEHLRYLDFHSPVEQSKIISLVIDQDRARQMGVTSEDLANFLNSSISGAIINQYREKRELIDVRIRGDQAERVNVEALSSLA